MSPQVNKLPKRILVLGPMNDALDSRGKQLSTHIPNIARATREVLSRLQKKLGDELQPCEVYEPPKEDGDNIPYGVFSLIMHCDFAIADISTGSPNVMYELAILHANGVPVILLGRPIFYLNQTNLIQIEDFSIDSLAAALSGSSFDKDGEPGPLERRLKSPEEKINRNPITQFFDGVHMINIAAATGLATGQFYNFLSYVIKDGGVFQSIPELKGIILIKPERLKDVSTVTGLLDRTFGEIKRDLEGNVIMEDGTPKMELPEIVVTDSSHPRRKYFVKRVGNYLIDYPTPISSLKVSKQYIRMGNFVRDQHGGRNDEEMQRFERRLINVYFETLEDLSTSPANSCDWSRVEVLSVQKAIEILKA